MKTIVRVSLSFARHKKDELNNFAILVIVCLKNNALFPTLPFSIAGLTTLQMAYQDAMNAAAVGGTKDTTALHEARNPLVAGLRRTAAHIQSLGLTKSQVMTSGFDVVVWSKPTITLTAPLVSRLDNSVSEQLRVGIKAVARARGYQVQHCTGTGTWKDVGTWPTTKGIVIPNLTPSTVYSVRIRAIGCSTRYGPWSASPSLMVT